LWKIFLKASCTYFVQKMLFLLNFSKHRVYVYQKTYFLKPTVTSKIFLAPFRYFYIQTITFQGYLLLFAQFILFISVVSKHIFLFRMFRYGSETPKRTETNRKNNLWVSRNKPKINRNRLSFGLFRFDPKIFFFCFVSRTP
jgi:hypothetical protein